MDFTTGENSSIEINVNAQHIITAATESFFGKKYEKISIEENTPVNTMLHFK